MELLNGVSTGQIIFPAAAVAVVLVCAALVFMFGFHSAEQPQFDKLPLVLDDRKSSNKKRKTKEKKSSPNRNAGEDGKTKSEKKSPTKEKKKEKEEVKEEKPKPKERPAEPKFVKKEEPKTKGKKKGDPAEKPSDFDDGSWQEVPKKEKKKVVKTPEEKEKKESPKKNKRDVRDVKKPKEADVEAGVVTKEPVEEKIRIISAVGPQIDEEAARALQAQVEEVQRVLKEAERRQQVALGQIADEGPEEAEAVVKDLRSSKKQESKEKDKAKKSEAAAAKIAKADSVEKEEKQAAEKLEDKPNVPVFDELGDSWNDAKAPKKGKKKARKDQ